MFESFTQKSLIDSLIKAAPRFIQCFLMNRLNDYYYHKDESQKMQTTNAQTIFFMCFKQLSCSYNIVFTWFKKGMVHDLRNHV